MAREGEERKKEGRILSVSIRFKVRVEGCSDGSLGKGDGNDLIIGDLLGC